MAIKLLPPSIDGKLPAQLGDTLVIPFTHNKTVGELDYSGMSLKIKTISTGLLIATLNDGSKEGSFILTTNVGLKIGQYYKVQLAYIDNNMNIGQYSTVGVFKYTDKPQLSIEQFDQGKPILSVYTPPQTDLNEKLYSYKYNIYKNNELVESSGEKLHNANDEYDVFYPQYIFEGGEYWVSYETKSINGLVSSISSAKKSFNLNNFNTLEVEPNKELGHNIISIPLSGEDNILARNNEIIAKGVSGEYIDNTIEQGISYTYRLINETNSFNAVVFNDYEDIFLSDNKHQLKIKFNPKISSFKETVMESKVDTLGGRFPFFFRNGDTKYKEFPISGLISYHIDDEQLFLKDIEILRASTPDSNDQVQFIKNTSLTGSNITMERIFRTKVLEWLNNGQPKLFRSPTEGVFIIRIMNVSLSPNDTVGRMLYTFNATAYEIDECNFTNLKKYKLIREE